MYLSKRMVPLAWLLIMWFGVVPIATSTADESYVTEMGYSTFITLMDTTLSTKKLETSSIRSYLSTHGTTTSTTNKVTNVTATTKHLSTSSTETEQSSASKTSTKQSSTSKVSTSEETSTVHVTVKSTTSNTTPLTTTNTTPSTASNTTPSKVSLASTTQYVTEKKSPTTLPPDTSSKFYSPTNAKTTVDSSESGHTSADEASTPSSSYERKSTTSRDSSPSPVIKFSSETLGSTITVFTSQVEATSDTIVFLVAAGAGGAIFVMVVAGCLYFGVRKSRKRRFWGSGANGSGIAEIGMKFTKTRSTENGLNLEDSDEVDTGLNCTFDEETEPKAQIKVQGERDSTEVNRTVTTFTPGPENFKRAQDRNLRDLLVRKDNEDDYLGDGDCRDSVAL